MIETKHTPGTLEVNTLAGTPYREVFCGDILIADTGCGPMVTTDEIEANAARIVLTWNLHDELLAALKDIDAAHSGTPKSCGHDYECVCVMDNARQAISKAEGRS